MSLVETLTQLQFPELAVCEAQLSQGGVAEAAFLELQGWGGDLRYE